MTLLFIRRSCEHMVFCRQESHAPITIWIKTISSCLVQSIFSGYNRIWLLKCVVDHSVFNNKSIACTILLVIYVDYVIIIANDQKKNNEVKVFFTKGFHTKDLGNLAYFLDWNWSFFTIYFISEKICYSSSWWNWNTKM